MPITRVYDATALDRLGLPVWAAVTPLAADLTVHAGKGATHEAARAGAVMEAIERVSAEAVVAERVHRSSYRRLRAREAVLDPSRFDLPFQTSYSPDAPCSWVRAEDRLGASEPWLALDLAISPAREGICAGPETNGLAAGHTAVQAILHGLYELIERDAVAVERFRRRHGAARPQRLIAPETLPQPAAHWVSVLTDLGLSVHIRELTSELGVPVFGTVLVDRGFPGREGRHTRFSGFGADLDAGRAVLGAVCEAVQAHTAVLVGARESFEDVSAVALSPSGLLDVLIAGARTIPFAPSPAPGPPDDPGAHLQIVLERLRASGFEHCLTVELTRAELGVPVFRVLVPGLAGPYGETARRPPLRLLRTLL